MKFIIYLFILFYQGVAIAQIYPASEVGNGSIAVVCRDNQGEVISIENLDVFESRHILEDWHVSPEFKVDRPAAEIVEKFLDALEAVDSFRAKAYKEELIQFGRTKTFVNGDSVLLTDTKDDFSPVKIDDENCKKENLISQINVPYGDSDSAERYIVNKDLFLNPLFSKGQRAIAILHELVYREMISEGWIGNSQPVRSYMSFLIQETFVKALKDGVTRETMARYLKKSRQIGLGFAHWHGQRIHLNEYNKRDGITHRYIEFCPNFNLYRGYLKTGWGPALLTQWNCETGDIEKTGLDEFKLPQCDYDYCSEDGSYIVKDKSFRLRADNKFKKKRKLLCNGDYPRLISSTCERKEITPVRTLLDINQSINGGKVLCQAELMDGVWAQLQFRIKCGRK